MKTIKPTFISKIVDIPEKINIFQGGEGDQIRFNKIQFTCFETTWLVRMSITKNNQPYCFIILYRDAYGKTRYSRDNIYSIATKEQEDQIKDFINDWISDYLKHEISKEEAIK